MGDVKAFVHQWCAKNSAEPSFEVRPTGKRRRLKIICSLYCYVI